MNQVHFRALLAMLTAVADRCDRADLDPVDIDDEIYVVDIIDGVLMSSAWANNPDHDSEIWLMRRVLRQCVTGRRV